MQTLLPSSRVKIILIGLLVLLAGASLVYNHFLIEKIMEQERSNVELWAKAFEHNFDPVHQEVSNKLNQAANILRTYPEVPDSLPRMILEAELAKSTNDFVTNELILPEDLFGIPVIVVDESGFMTAYRFLEDEELDTESLVEDFSALHDPITISFGDQRQMQRQYVYYGESPTIRYLRYFPFVQFSILAVLLGIGYTTYRSITRSEQSNLWVGMAKEAAHQLGTPLSSLYGWIQLLKDKYEDDEEALTIAYEVEKDVSRLKGIAERFNKIGSRPELKKIRIEPIIDQVMAYMERRLPQLGKNIEVRKSIRTNAKVKLNAEIFQWAIENLIKNSMDAINKNTGNAFISVSVTEESGRIIIDVEDSGSGIERKELKKIFKPGYSTKKRGWGLGLSLTKRIVEEYHNGKIYVLHSEVDKGTVIRITLPV
ncbi:MAG: HAMP domain-containing sensor histidine kinase [Balneolaceae bacterium]